jgi:hypothetical protein
MRVRTSSLISAIGVISSDATLWPSIGSGSTGTMSEPGSDSLCQSVRTEAYEGEVDQFMKRCL